VHRCGSNPGNSSGFGSVVKTVPLHSSIMSQRCAAENAGCPRRIAMVTSPPQQPDYAQWLQDEMQQLFLRAQKALEVAVTADDAKVGQPPKRLVWQRGRTKLYHYRPMAGSPPRHEERMGEGAVPSPLLMVHSLISKPYILDLYPGGSFVEF